MASEAAVPISAERRAGLHVVADAAAELDGWWDLAGQQRKVLAAIASEAGLRTARNRVRHHGLPLAEADDVRQDAWLRAHGTFTRRTDRYPGIDGETEAMRYAARVIDNAARDRARTARRRGGDRQVLFGVPDDRTEDDRAGSVVERLVAHTTGYDEVDASMTAIDLRDHVATLCATEPISCTGCPDTVVRATALHVANSLAVGRFSPADPRDDAATSSLVAEGLRRHDRATPSSDAARRQRSSRCGRCVRELLGAAWRMLAGAR